MNTNKNNAADPLDFRINGAHASIEKSEKVTLEDLIEELVINQKDHNDAMLDRYDQIISLLRNISDKL